MTARAAKTAAAEALGRKIEHGALSFEFPDHRPFSSCAGLAANAVNSARIPDSGVNLADARRSVSGGSLKAATAAHKHPAHGGNDG